MFALGYGVLWFGYHQILAVVLIVPLAIRLPGVTYQVVSSPSRAGIHGIRTDLNDVLSARRRRAAELKITVRELLRREELLASDPSLRIGIFDPIRAAWRKL
jgi:hypothetical protein